MPEYAWSRVPVGSVSGGKVLLKRFYHEGLAQASYLVGCETTKTALVIDPNRDADAYLDGARDAGMRITHVTETHIHADYVSGSRELAARAGAQLLLSAEGGGDWAYGRDISARAIHLGNGDSFEVGRVRVDVVHTPGHTPEHLMFLITDTGSADRPVGAATGDFIFVGDVGRPDLLERAAGMEGTMRAAAAELFRSLGGTAALPDYLQLWPGHGAGSACGKSLGALPHTTLGYERLYNWAFQIHDVATFTRAVLDGQPEPPPYFAMMKRVNRDGPAIRGHVAVPPRTTRDSASSHRATSLLVDLRPTADFAAGHIPGAINVPFSKSFLRYAGAVLPYDRDLYLVTDPSGESHAARAAAELSLIGLDRVAGYVDEVGAVRNGELERVTRLEPEVVARDARSGRVSVIDVRERSEWESGHIPGSLNVPLSSFHDPSVALPADRPLVLYCQGGSRSAVGASVLLARGRQDVANMVGGFTEWERDGLPVER